MDKVDQIKIFTRVAQCKSFTQVANEFQLPRSSITTAVQSLEHQLQTRLLHRTTRSVTLTTDGEHWLKRMLPLLEEFEELYRPTTKKPQPNGCVRIDVPSRIARLLLAPNLPKLLTNAPNLSIELRSSDAFVDIIADGIDIALRVGELADSNLISQPLGQLRMVHCASPSYIQNYGIPKNLDDFMKNHWIIQWSSATTKQIYPWETLVAGKKHEIYPRAKITTNTAESYIACALSGLGIIQVPQYDIEHELITGQLVEILQAYPAPTKTIHAIMPSRKQRPLKIDHTLQWLKDTLQNVIKPPPHAPAHPHDTTNAPLPQPPHA